MKKFLMAICVVVFLLMAGKMTKAVISMNIEEIEAISQAQEETNHIDKNIFYDILATGEISLSSLSQPNFARARMHRTLSLQMSLFLKNVVRCISKIDSAFALHNGHLYNTTIHHFISQPFCKHYYVFALRHIII